MVDMLRALKEKEPLFRGDGEVNRPTLAVHYIFQKSWLAGTLPEAFKIDPKS